MRPGHDLTGGACSHGLYRWSPGLIAVVGVLLGGCGEPPETALQPDHSEAITRVFESLRSELSVSGRPAPTSHSLGARMVEHNVPGVSVAVVNEGRLAWTRAVGLKEQGGADSVDVSTLFQAASISKPVAATAILSLVDEGTLDLDRPVNDYLTSWQLPENALTAEEPVTLRRLVSHGAGTTVWGFPGYTLTEELPTVPQILDGLPPANTPPVRVDLTPGHGWRYSGGGVTIAQLVVTDVTGTSFSEVLDERVLGPSGMGLSTFDQPLPPSRRQEAASGHQSDGNVLTGGSHVYPELAAAGLWTTPTDLVAWAIAIAGAYQGVSEAVLPQDLAREMLTAQHGTTGLGPALGGAGSGFYFGHGGANAGFRAQLVYFPETGQGAAVMSNGDNGARLNREILLSLGQEYGWPDYSEVTPVVQDVAALEAYSGTFTASQLPIELTFGAEDGVLIVEGVGALGRQEVVLLTPDRGITLESGTEIVFRRDASGVVSEVESMGLILVGRE